MVRQLASRRRKTANGETKALVLREESSVKGELFMEIVINFPTAHDKIFSYLLVRTLYFCTQAIRKQHTQIRANAILLRIYALCSRKFGTGKVKLYASSKQRRLQLGITVYFDD